MVMFDTLLMKNNSGPQICTTADEESLTFIGAEEKDAMKESKAEGEKEGFRGRGRGVQNKAPSITQVEKRHSTALSKRIHSLNITIGEESGRSWEGHPSIHNLTLRLSVCTNSIPLPVQFSSLYKHDKCTF